MASAAPIPGVDTRYDALGAYVSDAAHFQQYLSFNMVQVYEQEEDTFLDAIAVNEYPHPGMRHGRGVLRWGGDGGEPGPDPDPGRPIRSSASAGGNGALCQINTDITLTDMEFALEFNDTLGVLPAS